ncbi:MAG: hypothetical protein H6901_08665 [Rhodobacteraceae bacterium]|nr:hypothetical protein [Paracoccaceae bacterium]
MPVLNLQGVNILEGDNSFQYVNFTVTLDTAAFAPTVFHYYFQDVTATDSYGDYNGVASTATIPAGVTTYTVQVPVYGDTLIEGNETFQMVLTAAPGTVLAGNAAALVATATIFDNDDANPDPAAGPGAIATPVFGPASASASLPTLAVHDVSVVEGDSSFHYMRFLVTLDQVASAPVTFDYYTQDITASGASGDYSAGSSTVTIPAGEQAVWISIPVYGDSGAEANETFEIILTDINNAVFDGGAMTLTATGTIIDDDAGTPSLTPGIGSPGTGDPGPASAGPLPTVAIHDVAVIEGDSSFQYARVLITLDRPATAPITLQYYTQDGSASGANGDFNGTASSITLPAGTESTWVNIVVYGDTAIEGNETFSVVFTSITNGQFVDDVPAVEATITILDNDGGPLSGPAGVGGEAGGLPGVGSTAPILPTLSIHDASVIEGASSFHYARFLVTLDRPATTSVTFDWSLADGSASSASGDYADSSGTVTIAAGQSSTYIQVPVYGDTAIEGDENFHLVLTDIHNAAFAWNAAALVAVGTILDDDGGPLSGPGGVGGFASGAVGVEPGNAGPVVSVVSTSVNEGDSSFHYARVYVLLSEIATTDVTMDWSAVSGSATSGVDFIANSSGTFTIAAGSQSGYLNIGYYGDVAIEPDESFTVDFTNLTGAVFDNGLGSATATVTILDNDGGGTAGANGTGPDFTLISGPTSGSDILRGTPLDDIIHGLAGNDTIYGLGSDDTLYGDGQNDLIMASGGNDLAYGGSGDDTLYGGWGSDTLTGGTGDDSVFGGSWGDLLGGDGGNDLVNGQDGDDRVYGGWGSDTLQGGNGNDSLYGGTWGDLLGGEGGNDLVYGQDGHDRLYGSWGSDTLLGGTGNDSLYGGTWGDVLGGDAGNDFLNGQGGHDRLYGGAGADTLYGGNGNDTLVGGAGPDRMSGNAGADVFVFRSQAEVGLGGARDVIADFTGGQDMMDFSAMGMSFSGASGFTSTAGEMIALASGGDTILAGDIDGDGVADFEVMLLGVTSVTGAMFV